MVPGIKVRFSIPPKFLSMLNLTRSFQIIPAPASIKADSEFSSSTFIPLIETLIIIPSKSFVKRILLPPPRKYFFASLNFLSIIS